MAIAKPSLPWPCGRSERGRKRKVRVRTQGNDVFRHDRPIVRVGKNRDAIALDVVVAMGGRARAPRARATAFALATVRAVEHDVPRSSRRAPPSPP